MKVNIPATRDPFVNAQFVPAGHDKDSGEERFWATTCNTNSGCIGVLITPTGKNKVFRFDYDKKQFVFYGASYAGNDIMYLSGYLDEVVKLDLNTGETSTFSTGLPHDLSFSGMVYDPATEKVFSTAYCQGDLKRKGFSFDSKSKKTAITYQDIPLKNNQLRFSLKNNDGTYTFSNVISDFELLLWDPKSDKIEVILENRIITGHIYEYCVLINREDGAIYLPNYGWFDPIKRCFVEGPKAPHEATWFALKDNVAYGAEQNDSGNVTLYKWDLKNGNFTKIVEIPDVTAYNFRLSKDCKILCINIYGYFYRVDPDKATIECSVKLDTDAIGHIDCMYRINEDRLLCTPFITQRFFEIDLKTNKSVDLGRATGGFGEVLKVSELNKKIYMASYTKGQLVEYDPNQHANFPENPRLIVNPPHGVMRPVGMCNDDDNIYYSCSHEYGSLGSMLVKHSPLRGITEFVDNPIPYQMIRSMFFDKTTNTIIAGSTYAADCNSCIPKEETAVIAKIDSKTLNVLNIIKAPGNAYECAIVGKLSETQYLYKHNWNKCSSVWMYVDAKSFDCAPFRIPKICDCNEYQIYYAGKPGYFVITYEGSVELWNLGKGELVKVICSESGFYKLFVQDNSIYLAYRQEIHIFENCLF